MEIQLIALRQDGLEPLPKIMGTIATPKGIAVVFFPETSIEVLTAIRDHLNTDLARMESERVMLRAMAGVPQGPVQ